MTAQRKPAGQQAREILGFLAEGLVTGEVPKKVQEGLAEEAAKFLGQRHPECPKCGGALEELETPDGMQVQVCAARCGKASR